MLQCPLFIHPLTLTIHPAHGCTLAPGAKQLGSGSGAGSGNIIPPEDLSQVEAAIRPPDAPAGAPPASTSAVEAAVNLVRDPSRQRAPKRSRLGRRGT